MAIPPDVFTHPLAQPPRGALFLLDCWELLLGVVYLQPDIPFLDLAGVNRVFNSSLVATPGDVSPIISASPSPPFLSFFPSLYVLQSDFLQLTLIQEPATST